MREVVAVFVVCLVVSAVVIPPCSAATLEFEGKYIAATDLPPGRGVVCFGTFLESLGYELGTKRLALIAVSDVSGVARCALEGDVPLRSVWAVVDLTTGAYILGMPAESPGAIREFDQRSFTAPGRLKQVLLPGTTHQEMLLVRPKGGAWTLSVGDGGASDEDGALDGHVSVSSAQFSAVAGSAPPPERFMPGDTLVAIDPFKLRLLAATVAR